MTDNRDVGISVTGDISDIDSALDNLINKMNELVDKTINVDINVNDEGLNTAATSMEEMGVKSGAAATLIDSNMDKATESIDELGLVAIASGNDLTTSMSGAAPAIDGVTSSATEASAATETVGDKGLETGQEMEYGFAQAALAIAGATLALEGTAQALDATNTRFGKMANSVIPEDELRDMVATLTHADFPTDEALNYMKTLRQLGITSKESLSGGAEDFHKMRSAVGTTDEQIIKFSNSLRVMGVDLNDISTSFNAVAYANANIVGGFDTYVAWMQKYDATFKEMGLNIDQTAVIISAATKKFGGGRAAYQGLNEAIKESNGDLTVLEQKLGMQPGALSRASEETARYSGTIERNSKITDEHTTILEKLWATLDDLGTKYGDSISLLTSFGAAIATALGAIFVAIPGVFRILDNLWDTEWEKWWKGGVQKAITRLKDAGTTISDTIKGWMGWGDDAAKAAGNVGSKVTSGTGEAADEVFKAAENIGKSWGKGAEGAMSFMDEATGKMRYFFQYTDGKFAEIFKDGRAPFFAEDAGKNIGKAFDKGVSESSSGILNSLQKMVGEIPTKIIDTIKGVKIPKLGVGEIGDVGTIGSKIADLIPDGFRSAITRLVPKLLGDVALIVGIIAQGLSGAGENWHKSILEQTKEAFGMDMWYEALKAINMNWIWDYFKMPFATLAQFIGLDKFTSISPDEFWGWIFGKDASTNFGNWLDTNISGPFNKFFLDLPANISKLISGEFKMPDIWGMLFGSQLEGGNVDDKSNNILYKFKDSLVNAWNEITAFFLNLPSEISGFVAGLSWDSFNAWLDSALFSIGSFAKTLYELPGNIYNALVNLPNTISGIFNSVIEYLKGLPNQLVIYAGNIWNGILNGLKLVEANLRNAITLPQRLFTDLVNFIKGLPAMLYTGAVNAYNRLVDGINSTIGRIKEAINNTVASINSGIQWIKDLPKNMYEWGANTIKSWRDGLVSWVSSNWEGLKGWLNDRLKSLFAGWESHSPPIEGPLKNIDSWGMGLSSAWISGIGDGIDKGKSFLANKLQSLVPEFQAGDYALNTNSVREIINPTPTTFQIQITNEFGDVNAQNREEAEKAVTQLSNQTTETTVESLEKALISNGYSIWNNKR